MEEILEINGVTYIKKERIAEIEKERDKALKDLELIKKVLGQSFKDLSSIITEDTIEEQPKIVRPTLDKVRPVIRKRKDACVPVNSAQKLFRIRHMDDKGRFFAQNNKPFSFTIKQVLIIQKTLYDGITNGEVDDLARELDINYQILHRIIYNYNKNIFDKFIIKWNNMNQPVVSAKNKPVENNPEKRKESVLYMWLYEDCCWFFKDSCQ